LEEWKKWSDFIVSCVDEAHRPEVRDMGRTIAEALMEEGEIRAKRRTLLRQLELRFKRVSPAITAKVEATQEERQLDTWLDEFATARKISDISFRSVPTS
jgi:hypothetical protein